ncbi:MAG: hypothetical protein KF872_11120 [Chitinophagales bacterium]|nr:hypothetical protein [Chitinophagales bacterium]
MKNNILLFAIAGILLTSSSCSTIRWSTRDTASMDVTKSGIYTKAKVADLKIENTRSVGSSAGDVKEKTIETIKAEALQNALRSTQADILVEPIYEVERDGRTITARVSGFPAKITGFKDITAEDTLSFNTASKMYIRSANLSSTDAAQQAIQKDYNAREKRRRIGKAIGLGVGLGVALPVILGVGLGVGLGYE